MSDPTDPTAGTEAPPPPDAPPAPAPTPDAPPAPAAPPAGALALPLTALKLGELKVAPSALAAFRRGDRLGLLAGMGIDVGQLPAETRANVERLAELALEVRRQSVSVLGTHDAFVRHTPAGSLLQVIAPVKLSLADKTLYQIPIRRKVKLGTTEVVGRNYEGPTQWIELPQSSAEVTYSGLLKINGVAGCAVGQPPTVVVDGEEKTNPYVQRAQAPGGRLGDIVRVVIHVAVVGPTPMTGNPVVVNYTLDYDPTKDLQNMLASVAQSAPEECFLVDEEELGTDACPKRPGWKFTPIFGGVGYYYNLRIEAVKGVMADFINLLQNAQKKAQTIARRNAMKSHPAIAVHTVEVDKSGRAIIPVIGWAGNADAMKKWQDLCDRLSRGLPLPEAADVEVIAARTEVYEPVKHDLRSGDDPDAERQVDDGGLDPEVAEKGRLIDAIDRAINMLRRPSDVASLNYRPDRMTLEELRSCLERANTILDAQ